MNVRTGGSFGRSFFFIPPPFLTLLKMPHLRRPNNEEQILICKLMEESLPPVHEISEQEALFERSTFTREYEYSANLLASRNHCFFDAANDDDEAMLLVQDMETYHARLMEKILERLALH